MTLTYKKTHALMKGLFSTVILQLFLIVTGAEAGCYTPFDVTAMLEYSAAAAMCIFGGWLLFEYILKREDNI